MKKKKKRPTMNEDIKTFPIYQLMRNGILKRIYWIENTDSYDHSVYNLHHFIEKQHYWGNEQWYEDRGIKQKLILMPTAVHEQVHFQAVHNLNDDDFYGWFKIDRWELVFNRKHSKY